ncbi:hypothetical protein EV192_12226 [Actinocrispum wychmicini]|uniref:Uncharacterized protein n=1 Tax=Actinocrispum wychmicini TaxID=1213861 RepID=A0A4R2ILG5_9PSEU|nr:hypothetical protein EV192_12226 [Actinocrispum wychmicini]
MGELYRRSPRKWITSRNMSVTEGDIKLCVVATFANPSAQYSDRVTSMVGKGALQLPATSEKYSSMARNGYPTAVTRVRVVRD